jgi:hypothetical protein
VARVFGNNRRQNQVVGIELATGCEVPVRAIKNRCEAEENGMEKSITTVKEQHENRLMQLPEVVSVGIGRDPNGRPVITVGLSKHNPESEKQIPGEIEGHPVVVSVIGSIRTDQT